MTSLDSFLKDVRLWNVVKCTFVIAGVVLASLLVYRFYYVFFAVVVAMMLYLAIRPLVELLSRLGIHKGVGMVVGYGVVVLLIVGFLLLLIPMLIAQAQTITAKLPEYYGLLKQLLAGSGIELLQLIDSYLPDTLVLDRIPAFLINIPETTNDTTVDTTIAASQPMFSLTTIFFSIFITISVFAMAYYWMRDRDKIIYQFLLFLPAPKREAVEKLIEEMEEKVGRFYQGQLILCALVGGASFIAYWLVGLPYALTLGAFAFVFEAVPMIGPMLGAVPAILIALTISPTMTAEVVAINALVQFLENNIFVPRIMDRTVGVNPILTVLAIAGFTTLLGLPGALLAIPLAAIIQVLFERTIFHFSPATSPENTVAAGNEINVSQRNHFSVMRIEAQDLASDIRKRMRQADPAITSASLQIEEMIESFALEFDQLLAMRETTPQTVATAQTMATPQTAAKKEEAKGRHQ